MVFLPKRGLDLEIVFLQKRGVNREIISLPKRRVPRQSPRRGGQKSIAPARQQSSKAKAAKYDGPKASYPLQQSCVVVVILNAKGEPPFQAEARGSLGLEVMARTMNIE